MFFYVSVHRLIPLVGCDVYVLPHLSVGKIACVNFLESHVFDLNTSLHIAIVD